MSSMRNAVQRRNHKERAQPASREKWGILEKHKDYSLRAKDYNEKKRRLKLLRQKAAARNPDEFSFAMMSSRTRDGGQRVAERGNQALSQDAVRLLKTQDAGYLRTAAQRTRKLREKVEQAISIGDDDHGSDQRHHHQSGQVARTHLAFAETRADQENWDTKASPASRSKASYSFALGSRDDNEDNVDDSETHSEDRPGPDQKPSIEHPTSSPDLREARAVRKRRKRQREARSNTLEALRKREDDLRAAERELDAQRARMNNRSVLSVNKRGVRFKARQRKR